MSRGKENNYVPLSNGERTPSPNRLLKWKDKLTIKVEIENDIGVTKEKSSLRYSLNLQPPSFSLMCRKRQFLEFFEFFNQSNMDTDPSEVHPCYSGDLQNGIPFFLLGHVRQKTIWSLYVSHPYYPLFFKKLGLFCLK